LENIMFRIIVSDTPIKSVNRLHGLSLYQTTNVMQADCAFTRYQKKTKDSGDVICYGKHVTLLHNDNIRRSC
jgi:hypothetical protein